jgi:RimJ/RimL family protein N-acetyltransferase
MAVRPDSPTAAIVDLMHELTTPRLVLRMFRADDLDAYAAMCADPEVMRHIGAGGPVGPDVAWRHMALFLGEWALHGHGMWAVQERASGRLIGRAGFLDPVGWPGCELGWLLARDAWGQGYAFEAARAAIDHGRAQLGLGELISLIRPDNARSIALAERLGAVRESKIEFMGGETLLYRHALPSA